MWKKKKPFKEQGISVALNVLDCDIEVSEFKLQFSFEIIPLSEVWTLLPPQLWIK